MTDAEKLAAQAALMDAGGHFPYAGLPTFMRLPHRRDVAGYEAVVMGAPLDLGTYHRSGARLGPRHLREMSLLVLGELCPADHFHGRRLADWGDCWFAPGDLDHAHHQIEATATAILEQGPKLLTLGGDHSLSLPALRAHGKKHGKLALLHFDSHTDVYDTWPKPYHGAPFAIALKEGLLDVDHSLQLGIRASTPSIAAASPLPFVDADWVLDRTPAAIAEEISRTVGDRPVYLTFDIDFLDPAYAPGTGTPVIGGPTTSHAARILKSLRGINVVGGDVVELSPPFDPPGQPTALAAASMAFLILELMLTAR